MVEYVIDRTLEKERKKNNRSSLIHLGKIGLYSFMGISGIAGWFILWNYILKPTTVDPQNMVRVWTNRYGEMWFEYYASQILMGLIGGSTIACIGLEAYNHLKRKRSDK